MAVREGFKTKEELDKFQELLKEDNEVVYYAWRVAVNLALRMGDVTSITITEAEEMLRTGKYDRVDSKTKKKNSKIVNNATKEALTMALEIRKKIGREHNPHLFISASNRSAKSVKGITVDAIYKVLKNVADWNGIDIKIGAHSGRKTWGYLAYRQGIDLQVIRRTLNHANVETTQLYIGICEEEVNDALAELEL